MEKFPSGKQPSSGSGWRALSSCRVLSSSPRLAVPAHNYSQDDPHQNSLKCLLSFTEPRQREKDKSNYPLKLPLNPEFLLFQYALLAGIIFLKNHKREYSYFFVTVHLWHWTDIILMFV